MPVGIDAGIKACWCAIGRGSLAVAVNAEHLASNQGWALRHSAIVRVARGHIKKAIARAKAQPPAIVRAWAAKRVVAGAGFVLNISDDVGAIRNAVPSVVDLQSHHAVAARRSQAG